MEQIDKKSHNFFILKNCSAKLLEGNYLNKYFPYKSSQLVFKLDIYKCINVVMLHLKGETGIVKGAKKTI